MRSIHCEIGHYSRGVWLAMAKVIGSTQIRRRVKRMIGGSSRGSGYKGVCLAAGVFAVVMVGGTSMSSATFAADAVKDGPKGDSIENDAIEINKADHLPIIDGLFPEPSLQAPKSFVARQRYQFAFLDMLERYSPNAGYPQLDAKAAISKEKLKAAIDKAAADYLNRFLPPKTISQLTADEVKALDGLTKKVANDALMKHARGLHLYITNENPGEGYPFEVGEWSRDSKMPSDEQLWEGQMGLWVQRDIARAIMQTNQVSVPNGCVLDVPVKRIVGIHVDPGYVGWGTSVPGPERRLKQNMNERIGNTLYDVKRARVSLIVEEKRLPEFLKNLAQVNLIKVVKKDITRIDADKEASENYVYGDGVQCVRVDLVIDSIWIRQWTQELMPQMVRDTLRVPGPRIEFVQ